MPHSSAEKLGLLSDGVGSEGKGYIPSDKPYSRRLSRSTKTFLTTFLVLLLLYAYRVENSTIIRKWPIKENYSWGISPRPRTLNSTPASTATNVLASPSR
ncbi:hypothetical protein B9Z19DRAFT_843145 [Tuber borchii]|uniref:Uncharacterized protein n=1 Tax=Tuber borchii TaxID=42251 RepID=A0A2T6ZUY4_TUBBO|nr:hypothetical protein B9Z19DRAFT_843145 [Tuber borchii]